MTDYLQRVLSCPSFPTYLLKAAKERAYETTNSKGQPEVWLDTHGPGVGYHFYFDKDRNPGQVFDAHLIIGGHGFKPEQIVGLG